MNDVQWNALSPWAKLFKSRKFWILILDTVVSTALFVTGAYFPNATETVNFAIVALQPIFMMLIGAIAYEDAQETHKE